MRRALFWFAALLIALPLAGAASFWLFFDAEALKPRVSAEVERRTGRALTIGRLSLTPSLVPRMTAEAITLANAPGLAAPMLTARRAELRLALLPLLSGRVELRRIEAEGVELRLEAGNWVFARPAAAPSAQPAPPDAQQSRLELVLGDIVLRDARLHAMGESFVIGSARLEPDGALTATLLARGVEVAVTGRIPALADGPLALRLELPGAHLAADGERRGLGLTAQVAMEAASLPALAPLLGRDLPALTGVSAAAEVALEGGWRVSALSAQAAGGVLGPLSLTGARLSAAHPEAPSNIEARGIWRDEAVLIAGTGPSLAALLAAAPLPVALTLTAPGTEARIQGTMRPRPDAAQPASPAAGPPPNGRAIPDWPLDLTLLRGFDADLTFEAGAWRLGGLALREVRGRFWNEAGRARLDPFDATLPGGRLSLRAAADAALDPPALQIAGGGQALDLAALLPGLDLAGRADLDLDLRGQGLSTRALAATLTGHLGLAVIEGRIGARLTQGMLAGLPGAPGGALPLTCLALRAEADRGLVRPRMLYIEGGLGRAAGEGAINLRDETLALRFATDLRIAGLRIRAPVPLTGSFLAPRLDWRGAGEGALAGDLGQQSERLLPGLGGLLRPGGPQPSLPDCGPALAVARGGRVGPVPAPRPAEEPRQGQRDAPATIDGLLRGLFGGR
jgi:hypothetical protein